MFEGSNQQRRIVAALAGAVMVPNAMPLASTAVERERGHNFGLGHVSESDHGNLTMSDRSNGPCQSSERSLGRGDAKSLNNKY